VFAELVHGVEMGELAAAAAGLSAALPGNGGTPVGLTPSKVGRGRFRRCV